MKFKELACETFCGIPGSCRQKHGVGQMPFKSTQWVILFDAFGRGSCSWERIPQILMMPGGISQLLHAGVTSTYAHDARFWSFRACVVFSCKECLLMATLEKGTWLHERPLPNLDESTKSLGALQKNTDFLEGNNESIGYSVQYCKTDPRTCQARLSYHSQRKRTNRRS